jgi:hypothetical protein
VSNVHRFPCPSCGKVLKVDDELLARISAGAFAMNVGFCLLAADILVSRPH